MIVSTHSREFLDAVPRQARILIQRHGDVHEAVQGPTARFAAGVMRGDANPEARIYCEDAVAEHIVGAALTSELRRRTRIIPIGAKSELAGMARFHQRAGNGELQALVWDGDVTDGEIERSIRTAVRRQPGELDVTRVSWARLPGADGPERWLIDTLNTIEGSAGLAAELRVAQHEAEGLLAELRAVGDAHDITFAMATKMRLRPDEALAKLIAAVQKLETEPLAPLREFVRRVLNGETVQDPVLPDTGSVIR